MTLKTNPADVDRTLLPNGQQREYLILSDEERAKGFVRPVRTTYLHVGRRPVHLLRDLTPDELTLYGSEFVKFEVYPEGTSATGRFWTQKELSSGCGAETIMGQKLAETYARQPDFYGGTFCSHCGAHFPVGADGEFVWDGTSERVGT